MLSSFAMLAPLKRKLNNQYARDEFVRRQLQALAAGSRILDAGCGSQRYRPDCEHLEYLAQDFGGYTVDEQKSLGTEGVGGTAGYEYGRLDYVGDIWAIDAADASFDAILCTEVFEHIPYPNETMREFARLLKPGGTLVLTAPSNCLRHMDPYFFYSGFSDRWFAHALEANGFRIPQIEPVGDYYSWLSVEMARTARMNSVFAKIMLAPAFLYYLMKKPTAQSVATLCMGYHVVAQRA